MGRRRSARLVEMKEKSRVGESLSKNRGGFALNRQLQFSLIRSNGMRNRLWRLSVFLIVGLASAPNGFGGVFGGTIELISNSSNKISVQAASSSLVQEFQLSSSTRVRIDGKVARLSGLERGMRVSVFTSSSGAVTRLNARSASSSSSSTSPKPKPIRKKPSKSKSTGRLRETSTAADVQWSQFRGPNRDNVSPETRLLSNWPSSGPKLLWTTRGLGRGYSTVSISNGLVYTMGNVGRDETILAFDLASGELIWQRPHAPASRLSAGNGPRGTPTIDGEWLYALGGNGDLSCVNARTGDLRWTKNILKQFQASNITWGICESVLIDGERLICTPGGPDATMVALNKENGSTVWSAAVPGNPQASYASPIVAVVGGVRQYVNFTSRAVIGVRADDGTFLWQENSSANGTANCSTPVFYRDHVFSASGYGTGGALLQLRSSRNRTVARKVFFSNEMKNHHGGMVVVDGYLYGTNDQVLLCINLRNGRIMWRNRSVGKGALTCADDHIYLRSESGPVALIESSPSGYRETGRFDQPQRSGASAWPHPVVANGKLFLRDQDKLLCYDLSD